MFLFFFLQEKRETHEKQEIFSNFGNLTEGKISGTLRIPTFGGGNWKIWKQKKSAKKIWKFRTKRPSIRTALRSSTFNSSDQYAWTYLSRIRSRYSNGSCWNPWWPFTSPFQYHQRPALRFSVSGLVAPDARHLEATRDSKPNQNSPSTPQSKGKSNYLDTHKAR